MAKCYYCGKSAGLLLNECDSCLASRKDKEAENHLAANPPTPSIGPSLVTTNPTLPGLIVTETLGIARGISVRSRSIFGNLAAGVEAAIGGDVTTMERLCEDTRQKAFERMCEHAAAIGANAVTGMRFDANEVWQGVTEVLCYGTAIVAASQQKEH